MKTTRNPYKWQPGSCVACGEPTDTQLALNGEAEWHVAALVRLGIPMNEAEATVKDGFHGRLPWGRKTLLVQVCAACAGRGFPGVRLNKLTHGELQAWVAASTDPSYSGPEIKVNAYIQPEETLL